MSNSAAAIASRTLSASGYKRCVLVIVDGARPDVFRYLLRRGRLPGIQEHLLDRGVFLDAVTSFPSTTGPAYVPFVMGCYPGTVGVPGIRWMDKTRLGRREPGWRRSYMGYEALFFNRDLDGSRRTLFEYFEHPVNILNMVTKGLRRGGNASRCTRPALYALAHFTELWGLVDRAAGWHLLRALRNPRNDLIVAVFPGVDAFAHRSHPFEPRVLRAYEWVDTVIGEACRLLQRRGEYEQTLWFVVSDHGLSWTHSHLDLVDFLDRRGYRALDYPRVYRRRARAAVMISGNAMANVYFQNSRGWLAPTYRQDLDRDDGELLLSLVERPEVDILAIRDYRGGIHVMSERGVANIAFEDGLIRYTPLVGDPFGYDHLPERFTWRQSLELTLATDYPDAPAQLLQLFRTRRAGDLLVSAARGCDLRANYEWPTHCASHGALIREQMAVPIISNHPIPDIPARTADVFPTLLALMGRPLPANIDGVSLVD